MLSLLESIRHFDCNRRARFAIGRDDRNARTSRASKQRGNQDQKRESADWDAQVSMQSVFRTSKRKE